MTGHGRSVKLWICPNIKTLCMDLWREQSQTLKYFAELKYFVEQKTHLSKASTPLQQILRQSLSINQTTSFIKEAPDPPSFFSCKSENTNYNAWTYPLLLPSTFFLPYHAIIIRLTRSTPQYETNTAPLYQLVRMLIFRLGVQLNTIAFNTIQTAFSTNSWS